MQMKQKNRINCLVLLDVQSWITVIFFKIILSIAAYGITAVAVALMIAAPSDNKKNEQLYEIIQQVIFYAVVAFELYIIWWLLQFISQCQQKLGKGQNEGIFSHYCVFVGKMRNQRTLGKQLVLCGHFQAKISFFTLVSDPVKPIISISR